jgi:hypothetical protein
MEDKNKASCAWLSPPKCLFAFRVISTNGDQIQLGIRAKFTAVGGPGTYSASLQDLEKIPEKQYWFEPREKLEIDVPGPGSMMLTGELTDHIPPFVTEGSDVQMDPKPGELRVISPLLLRGKEVVYDFEGSYAIEKDRGVRMYIPGEGLWVLSLLPLEDAVEGRINLNRISFEMAGRSYTLVTAAPVARSENIWILHDAKYRPADGVGSGFVGAADLTHLLSKLPAKN